MEMYADKVIFFLYDLNLYIGHRLARYAMYCVWMEQHLLLGKLHTSNTKEEFIAYRARRLTDVMGCLNPK